MSYDKNGMKLPLVTDSKVTEAQRTIADELVNGIKIPTPEMLAAIITYHRLFNTVGALLAEEDADSATHRIRSYQVVAGNVIQELMAERKIEEAQDLLLKSAAHAFLAAIKLRLR